MFTIETKVTAPRTELIHTQMKVTQRIHISTESAILFWQIAQLNETQLAKLNSNDQTAA